jgi:hypothetical protein
VIFDGQVERGTDITYGSGDYVWATSVPGSVLRHLAVVESAHSIRSAAGARWLVRLRRPSGWTSGARHMFVERRLTGDELAHNRRLELIPPFGERP